MTPANNTYRLGGGGGTLTITSPLIDNGATLRSLVVGGNVTLAGANTYGGPTTVNNGALRIAAGGSLNASSNAITLNGGALLVDSTAPLTRPITFGGGTFGGLGTYNGSLVVGDGHLSPGDGGVGTLTVGGNVSLSADSVLDYDFGTTPGTCDLTALTGSGRSLVLDGLINVTVNGSMAAGSYTIISGASSITDNGLTFGNVPAGHNWSYSLVNHSGLYDVVVTVPEPGAIVLLMTALLSLATYVWRKGRSG